VEKSRREAELIEEQKKNCNTGLFKKIITWLYGIVRLKGKMRWGRLSSTPTKV
jgi:hypothetical protein